MATLDHEDGSVRTDVTCAWDATPELPAHAAHFLAPPQVLDAPVHTQAGLSCGTSMHPHRAQERTLRPHSHAADAHSHAADAHILLCACRRRGAAASCRRRQFPPATESATLCLPGPGYLAGTCWPGITAWWCSTQAQTHQRPWGWCSFCQARPCPYWSAVQQAPKARVGLYLQSWRARAAERSMTGVSCR